MSIHRSLAIALWLMAAVGAYALAASWADNAQSGKVHPWALIVLFWGAAAVSVAVHHLSRYLADHLAQAPDVLRRLYLAQGRHGLRRSQLHLALGRDVLRRFRLHLAQGWDALRRFWSQHKVSGLPSAGTSDRVVEIGS